MKAPLEQIRNAAYRSRDLIGSIRAMVKRDGRNRTPLDLNDLVRDVLALTERDLQRSHISVELQLDEHLPWTKGDRVQLQQALINLITNAMANQKWPRILRITSAIEGPSGVVISVADTGKGINPKIVDRIFNPLFTTKSNGMGMGLAIADRSSRGTRVDFRRQSALKAARYFNSCCRPTSPDRQTANIDSGCQSFARMRTGSGFCLRDGLFNFIQTPSVNGRTPIATTTWRRNLGIGGSNQ